MLISVIVRLETSVCRSPRRIKETPGYHKPAKPLSTIAVWSLALVIVCTVITSHAFYTPDIWKYVRLTTSFTASVKQFPFFFFFFPDHKQKGKISACNETISDNGYVLLKVCVCCAGSTTLLHHSWRCLHRIINFKMLSKKNAFRQSNASNVQSPQEVFIFFLRGQNVD